MPVKLRRVAFAFLAVLLISSAAAGLPAASVYYVNQDAIYDDPTQLPPTPVAIVFGAGVLPDGSPTWMLADRVDAAVGLYQSGKVRRLLMTGDNSRAGYDEVTAMKQRAVDRGVPADLVNLDYAGFRTYDSCYRAAAIFGITKAVLVTQRYHLPRALFLARSFGIESVGLAAGIDSYPNQDFYNLREFVALSVSWYEANVTRPSPRFLGDPVDLEHQNDR
ncbi:MAG TPA: ElyC/SanA/YdcF family protein [Chloroflexota bacterium]